jgi:hypothetical protein
MMRFFNWFFFIWLGSLLPVTVLIYTSSVHGELSSQIPPVLAAQRWRARKNERLGMAPQRPRCPCASA